jgi:hypothetical protein
MFWKVPKIWNGDVWILGGGPSLTSSFHIPKTIVDKVRNRNVPLSAYSPYMSAIHEKRVIATNMAFRIGNWIDLVLFGDVDFFKKNETPLSLFPGLRVALFPAGDDTEYTRPWLKSMTRTNLQILSTDPYKLNFNTNTGAAAINLAYLLGAQRIILVGFDMNIEGIHQHWHNGYRSVETEENEPSNDLKATFTTHSAKFPAIKNQLDKLGIEIVNTSLNSSITCIPKKPLEDLL